jgi:fructokinase
MSRLPVVVVGEALVDVMVPPEGETSSAVGGSPLNVVVGLARLGVPGVLITRIGDDEHGRLVGDHVRAAGAGLSEGSVVPGSTTSAATAHLDEEGAARYDFDLTWDLQQQPLPEARGLHVGSLGALLLPGRRAVEDLVRQADEAELFVSYDPNIRPALVTDTEEAWHDVVDLASRCRLVKVSDEDLAVLRPGRPTDELARELLRSETTELVVVTRGAAGATAYTDGSAVDEPAPETTVVDTVGAGDSFMAALLAVLDGWDLPADGPGALAALDADHVAMLLRGAMQAAALTVSRRGANPPTRQELPATWPL